MLHGVYVLRYEIMRAAHYFLVLPQVPKANGGHKKNVWEIMRCPEYALKCNKSVHLPA